MNVEGYVTVDEFKKLREIVNQLLEMHDVDIRLTTKEKRLVREAKEDIRKGKKENFSSLETL